MENKTNTTSEIGFWGDRKNVEVLKSIWQQTPEEQAARSNKGRRCLVRGSNVEGYPVPKDFDLRELMSKYGSKVKPPFPEEAGNGVDQNRPGQILRIEQSLTIVQRRTTTKDEGPEDFGLTELMSGNEIAKPEPKLPKMCFRTSPPAIGCNRDDAVDFAIRYGVEPDDPKPSLFYRLRKGKYRKSF